MTTITQEILSISTLQDKHLALCLLEFIKVKHTLTIEENELCNIIIEQTNYLITNN
jgi:hypothetical protein